MQLNKSFLAIGNGRTDAITDICDSRVAFATENIQSAGGGDGDEAQFDNFQHCGGIKSVKTKYFEV